MQPPGDLRRTTASSTPIHSPGRLTATKASRTRGSRVELRVLDAELAHLPPAMLRAVELLGQPVVLGDHVALLVNGRRLGQRAAGGQRPGLAEDPGVADCTAGRGHAVDACLAIISRQAWGVNRSPLPSTTRDPACCFTSRRNSQRLGPTYFCCDRAAVDRDRRARRARRRRRKSRKNLSRLSAESSSPRRILTVTGIALGHRLADARHDFQRRFDLAQQITAAAAAQHFLAPGSRS